MSLFMSKCHIVGNLMSRRICNPEDIILIIALLSTVYSQINALLYVILIIKIVNLLSSESLFIFCIDIFVLFVNILIYKNEKKKSLY